MTKFFAYLGLATFLTGIQIFGLMYGWGLQPRSWGWIIAVPVVSALIRHIADKIDKEKA